jgi:dienelactone hydrolase
MTQLLLFTQQTPQALTNCAVETYVARPEDPHPDIGILLLTDVMGHRHINQQLIADQLAANGYLTIIPDILHGDPTPSVRPQGWTPRKWLDGPPGHHPDVTDPSVAKALGYMKSEMGVRSVGAVGYTFGSKYVTRFMRKGAGIEVGFVADASFVTEEEWGGISGPICVAAGAKDHVFSTEERHGTEKILQTLGVPYQMTVYSQAGHGFAARGDVSKKEVKVAKQQAFHQAVAWFDAFLRP